MSNCRSLNYKKRKFQAAQAQVTNLRYRMAEMSVKRNQAAMRWLGLQMEASSHMTILERCP